MKCGKAFLKARHALHDDQQSNPPTLGPGDAFFALDNMKPGLQQKFTDFLKDGNGKKDNLYVRKFTLVYDFDSVRARKLRVKGLGTVGQTETMIAVTSGEPLSVPMKKHTHYMDFNSGSVIAMVKLPPYSECWALSYEKKKLLYGKMRVPVGGKEDADDDNGGDECVEAGQEVPPTIDDFSATDAADKKPRATTRAAENIEPVHYHTLPENFFDNLQDTFFVKDIYDFTPSPEAALAFLKAKKGYMAVCFNDAHQKMLRDYVIDQVMLCFAKSGDPLFHAAYAAGIKDTKTSSVTAPVPKSKPQPKNNPKTKKVKKDKTKKEKAKSKKSSTSGSSSSSDSGSSA